MNRIIESEIYKIIRRFPTEAEYKSADDYINFYADDETSGNDLRELLIDWRDEHMAQCEHCGKWALKNEMEYCYGEYYCDEVCKQDHEEYTYDMRAEIYKDYIVGNR